MGTIDENGNKGRESMVFYKEWYENVAHLPKEEKYAFLDAVFRYAFYHEEVPDLQPTVRLGFNFAKGQMERDWKKYDETTRKNAEISKKRSEAAKKGNDARWKKDETSQNIANADSRHNDNEEENNNENKNKNKNIYVDGEGEEKDGNRISDSSSPSSPPQLPLEERVQNFYDEVMSYSSDYEEPMLANFFDYWSETNHDKTLMRFEMEKTWDMGYRLMRWAEKPYPF